MTFLISFEWPYFNFQLKVIYAKASTVLIKLA